MPAADPAPAAASRRLPGPVRRASLSGSAVAAVIYVLLASEGRAGLSRYRFTSDFYDVQARRLLHGHLTVPIERFGIEAFVVDGHTHTYFGPLPALLRMPVLLVTDRLDGRLTQVYSALAVALLAWAVSRLSWRVRRLVRTEADLDRADVIVAAAAPFLAVAGTTVLWLGATPVVYHEAILWGVATAVVASVALLDWIATPDRRRAVELGVALGAVLLARPSLGFGSVAAAGLVLGAALVASVPALRRLGRLASVATGRLPHLERRQVAGLAVAVVAPMAAYVAVNVARFDRPLGVPYGEQVWSDVDPARQAALEANGGSLFNLAYAPSTALAYFRPDGLTLSSLFPYVDFPRSRATVVGDPLFDDPVFDTRDRTASVPATMPALVLVAAGGLVACVHRRTRDALSPLRPLLAGGVVAVTGVLTIGFVAQRYLGDVVPTLLVLAAAGGHVLAAHWDRVRARRAVAVGVAVLGAWSVYANASLGLLTQRAYAPPDASTRQEFVELQHRLAVGWLPNDPASITVSGTCDPATVPPSDGALLTLDAGCEEATFWSDGVLWYPIEPF